MQFKKVQKATASEVIVEQILDGIQSGRIEPGEKLPSEKEMSLMFGVSRASVREAIRALTLMGYLEVFQGKGAFLKHGLPNGGISTDKLSSALSAGDSLDLVDIRNLLECKAVALAAKRAGRSQLDAILEPVEQMEKLKKDMPGFLEADFQFHMALARAANNDILLEIMNLLRNRMVKERDGFLSRSDTDVDSCSQTARKVYTAIKNGRADEAVECMGEHLRIVNREIEQIISEAPNK